MLLYAAFVIAARRKFELRAALGEQLTTEHHNGARAVAWLILLLALVASLDLHDVAILALLGEARAKPASCSPP
jgi:hypothetical protein